MTSARRVLFSGLDPVPICVTVAADATQEALFAAACMPSTLFMRTVRPYRVRQSTADTYELVIGPEGCGAVLLDALRWLARVTAAGIMGAVNQAQVLAFVQQYLERDKPEWRFEELTEHAATFINDRYHHAATDVDYRQGLTGKHHDAALATLVAELRQGVARQA